MDFDCSRYVIKLWHLFFPPINIFYQMCLTYDRTKLFMVAIVRLILMLFIFKYAYDKYKLIPPNQYKYPALLGIYGFIVYIVFNFIILVAGYYKDPSIPPDLTWKYLMKMEEKKQKEEKQKRELMIKEESERKPMRNYILEKLI